MLKVRIFQEKNHNITSILDRKPKLRDCRDSKDMKKETIIEGIIDIKMIEVEVIDQTIDPITIDQTEQMLMIGGRISLKKTTEEIEEIVHLLKRMTKVVLKREMKVKVVAVVVPKRVNFLANLLDHQIRNKEVNLKKSKDKRVTLQKDKLQKISRKTMI